MTMTDNTSEWALKFRVIRDEIVADKGFLYFFGLIEREESSGIYDLVVSAPWIGEGRRGDVEFIVEKTKARLTRDDFTRLSRIVVLAGNEPFIRDMTASFVVQDIFPYAEFGDIRANNTKITHAYVFDSIPPAKLAIPIFYPAQTTGSTILSDVAVKTISTKQVRTNIFPVSSPLVRAED
jgi:hypothetical protein